MKIDNLQKNKNKKACPAPVRRNLGVGGKLQNSEACPAKLQRSRGFTLIETIVAIFILVLAITGPMSAAQNSLKASFLARDQVIAFYLAQDAIEYLKNYKDTKILDNSSGTSKEIMPNAIINKCKDSAGPCELDTLKSHGSLSSDVKNCNISDTDCGSLYFSSTKKDYSPSSTNGIRSKFKRWVYINEIVEDQEYSVIVIIKWQSNYFAERQIIVQENLYNWLPN